MDNVLSLDEAIKLVMEPRNPGNGWPDDGAVGAKVWFRYPGFVRVVGGWPAGMFTDRQVVLQSQSEVDRYQEWMRLGAAVGAGK